MRAAREPISSFKEPQARAGSRKQEPYRALRTPRMRRGPPKIAIHEPQKTPNTHSGFSGRLGVKREYAEKASIARNAIPPSTKTRSTCDFPVKRLTQSRCPQWEYAGHHRKRGNSHAAPRLYPPSPPSPLPPHQSPPGRVTIDEPKHGPSQNAA